MKARLITCVMIIPQIWAKPCTQNTGNLGLIGTCSLYWKTHCPNQEAAGGTVLNQPVVLILKQPFKVSFSWKFGILKMHWRRKNLQSFSNISSRTSQSSLILINKLWTLSVQAECITWFTASRLQVIQSARTTRMLQDSELLKEVCDSIRVVSSTIPGPYNTVQHDGLLNWVPSHALVVIAIG